MQSGEGAGAGSLFGDEWKVLLSKSITVGGETWQKASADAALFSVTTLDGDFSMAKIFVIWPSSLKNDTLAAGRGSC